MISVVINSRDDARFARAAASYQAALSGTAHEIVRVADATGMCEGYNRGIARARGQRLLFSHDDVEILRPSGFAARLAAHFDRFDLFGIAGTRRLIGPAWDKAGLPWVFGMVVHDFAGHVRADGTPGGLRLYLFGRSARAVGGAQAVDGVLIAATRGVCEAVPFDAALLPGWHLYDIDFSYRAHLHRFRCGIVSDLAVLHASANGPEVWNSPEYLRSAMAFYHRHKTTLPPLPSRWPGYSPAWVDVADRDEACRAMSALLQDE